MVVRTLLVVSEPTMMVDFPTSATMAEDGRSLSGSASPLCNRTLSDKGASTLGTEAYQVIKESLSACAHP